MHPAPSELFVSSDERMQDPSPVRRRYLVHLFCVTEDGCATCRYISRICPWTARSGVRAETRERTFANECELIATINPLLPTGSDVRDVFVHIESPKGFYYILNLSNKEARLLGWRM